MLWHQHAINESRDDAGLPRINALWLWGGSDAMTIAARTDSVASSLPTPAATPVATIEAAYVDYLLGRGDNTELTIDSRLVSPSLAGDWSAWLAAMQALETERFAPLLASLTSGAQRDVTLLLSDAGRLAEWRATRAVMRKFWRSPSLATLASLPA